MPSLQRTSNLRTIASRFMKLCAVEFQDSLFGSIFYNRGPAILMERLHLRPPPSGSDSPTKHEAYRSGSPRNVEETVIHYTKQQAGGVTRDTIKRSFVDHLVSNGFGNRRSEKEENSKATIGLSKSEKTEAGTKKYYTVSTSMVWVSNSKAALKCIVML